MEAYFLLLESNIYREAFISGENEITINTGRFIFGIEKNSEEIVLKLVQAGDALFLTDLGQTFTVLDTVFELREPDVYNNIKKAVKSHNVVIVDGYELQKPLKIENFIDSYFSLLFLIDFLGTMRIFYT